MTTEIVLAEVLDEALEALTSLDTERLANLERRASKLLAEASSPAPPLQSTQKLLSKRDALAKLVGQSGRNLELLYLLNKRNRGDSWELSSR